MITGRPYQTITAHSVVPALWQQGKTAPIVCSPVGSGKTRMALMLAEARLKKGVADFWHLAHRRELITQPRDSFRLAGVECSTVLAGEEVNEKSRCRIASVQTLIRRELKPVGRVAVVSVDEAHRVVGPTYLSLRERFLAAYEKVYFVLWTATPYRLDGRSLGIVADALYEATTPGDLIDSGVLVDPIILGLAEPDSRGLHRAEGDFDRGEVQERYLKKSLVGDVVDSWVKHAGGAPTAGFAAGVEHSKTLVERFRERGVRAEHLDGTTPWPTRRRILARLAIGGLASNHPEALDVVWNVDCLTEGWDSESDYRAVLTDPDLRDLWLGKSYPPEYRPLQVISDCRLTDSTRVYRQIEGRVCRSYEGKRWAKILSHSGNWRRHGFLRDHCGFRLDEDKYLPSSKYRKNMPASRQCLGCLSVWPASTKTCGFCGDSLGAGVGAPSEDTAKHLGQVTKESLGTHIPVPNPGEERAYLRNLWVSHLRKCEKAKEAGKPLPKANQVAVIFRSRYGRWPGNELLATARKMAEDAEHGKRTSSP